MAERAERPLRIAVTLSRRSWGGASTMARDLAMGLAERGHEVTFLGHPRSPLRARLEGRVPFVPVLRGRDVPLLAMPGVLRALRARRVECILCGYRRDLSFILPVARLLGIPVALSWVAGPLTSPGPLQRALWKRVDAHVANSMATRSELRLHAPWLPEARVRVVYNGVDTAVIDAARPADLGLPEGAVGVGFIGRLSWEKGLGDLARAWPAVAEAVPGAELVIVGGGADEALLRRQLGDAPRVRWLGFRADGAAIMKALDVVVVPSRYESFGLVAAEAMAAGRPVVVARAGGLPEVVRDGVDGIVVEPASPERLAEAIVALCRDGARRSRMGEAGRQRIRAGFGIEAAVAGYERVLLALAGSGEPAGGVPAEGPARAVKGHLT